MSNETRKEYRKLSDDEKQQVERIKDAGEALLAAINAAGGEGRCLALGRTKAEESVMWAVKGVTA